jgi:predicted transcriptional regulator
MAFGIRELSKKLAQIRLKLHVKNIFILGKAHDETLIKHSRETVDWLLSKEEGYKVYVKCLEAYWRPTKLTKAAMSSRLWRIINPSMLRAYSKNIRRTKGG